MSRADALSEADDPATAADAASMETTCQLLDCGICFGGRASRADRARFAEKGAGGALWDWRRARPGETRSLAKGRLPARGRASVAHWTAFAFLLTALGRSLGGRRGSAGRRQGRMRKRRLARGCGTGDGAGEGAGRPSRGGFRNCGRHGRGPAREWAREGQGRVRAGAGPIAAQGWRSEAALRGSPAAFLALGHRTIAPRGGEAAGRPSLRAARAARRGSRAQRFGPVGRSSSVVGHGCVAVGGASSVWPTRSSSVWPTRILDRQAGDLRW